MAMTSLPADVRPAKIERDPTSLLVQRNSLLQEGVSCAQAILHAIEAADLFRALPADQNAQAEHNNGCWLIGMLSDQLARLQQQVDALDAAPSNTAGES